MLTIKNIAKSFGENQVLNDVTFSLRKGDIKVLMGTNGSGKTTLFNIISGFVKQNSGTVSINQHNTKRLPHYKINRLGIGRTFQDMRLIGDLTVKQNIMLAFPNQEGEKWWKNLFPGPKIKRQQQQNSQQAEQISKICFIDDVAQSKAAEISYGQQKLLNLACCIANNSQILLLDEPVAGVNPVYRDRLATIIQQLKKQGKALLIIEHNTDFIQTVSDSILFLNGGKVQEFKDYTTLKNDETVKDAFV